MTLELTNIDDNKLNDLLNLINQFNTQVSPAKIKIENGKADQDLIYKLASTYNLFYRELLSRIVLPSAILSTCNKIHSLDEQYDEMLEEVFEKLTSISMEHILLEIPDDKT